MKCIEIKVRHDEDFFFQTEEQLAGLIKQHSVGLDWLEFLT